MAPDLDIPDSALSDPESLELRLPAHALRSVLTRLELQLERFQREHVQLDDAGRLTLWYLQRSMRRLLGLTTQALHRALEERERAKPRHEPLDVREVAARVIEALQPDVRDREVALFLDAPRAAPLDSDPELLHLALHELLSYAIKHAPQGVVRLALSSDRAGVRCRLQLQAPAPPSGAGLEVAARVAALLGGRLQSNARDGELVLCLRRPHAPYLFRSERPPVERSAAPHLLLVEDDEEIREELAEVLREDGYDVDAVGDAAVASRSMKSSPPPDLILLDLKLPGVDGWQFRDAQLEDPRLAAVPVCLLSAEGDVKHTAEDLGAAAWVSKPFAVPALLETVRGLVRRG